MNKYLILGGSPRGQVMAHLRQVGPGWHRCAASSPVFQEFPVMIKRPYDSLRPVSSLSLAAALFAYSATAAAQEDGADSMDEPVDGSGLDDMDEEDDATTLDEEGSESEVAPEESTSDLPDDVEREPDGSTQLLMGLRYRMLITPKFLINMFGVDGGRTVLLHGVGPEIGGYFGKTADGFMVFFSPTYVGYGLEETPFKGKNDDDSAWEVVESRMKVWYLTVDAMWDHKIIERLSFNLGIGAGLGIVAGKLYRNEAYVNDTDPDIDADPDKGWPNLSKCQGPGNPAFAGDQCPGDGNYGEADRWPVYPWLNFQAGIKYQPVDEFIARFEFGLGSSGFWMGLGADYSLFL